LQRGRVSGTGEVQFPISYSLGLAGWICRGSLGKLTASHAVRAAQEKAMIKVTILYPNGPGTTFDMAYYTSKHMPMVQKKCAPACKSIAADLGIGGAEPGSKPAYIAIGYLTFESVDAFQKAFGPHAKEILADIPNYTNAQPVIQISEIKL
jgi:uncharacterized protein (TIGR02118 family)